MLWLLVSLTKMVYVETTCRACNAKLCYLRHYRGPQENEVLVRAQVSQLVSEVQRHTPCNKK